MINLCKETDSIVCVINFFIHVFGRTFYHFSALMYSYLWRNRTFKKLLQMYFDINILAGWEMYIPQQISNIQLIALFLEIAGVDFKSSPVPSQTGEILMFWCFTKPCRFIDPLLNAPVFEMICRARLLKIFWEKKEVLITSISSFSTFAFFLL